jgi:hypothetical protein
VVAGDELVRVWSVACATVIMSVIAGWDRRPLTIGLCQREKKAVQKACWAGGRASWRAMANFAAVLGDDDADFSLGPGCDTHATPLFTLIPSLRLCAGSDCEKSHVFLLRLSLSRHSAHCEREVQGEGDSERLRVFYSTPPPAHRGALTCEKS